MTELLLPAGSIEKMKYAYAYGADAVYLGLADFSLRALRKGELVDESNLASAVDIAHSLNKKIYCTFNIFACDDDIKKLDNTLDIIKDAKPDALIISDFGVYRKLKNLGIDLHISTQTNILNSEAVKFWRDAGAKRVILARELSEKQIENIRKEVPDIELEIFVHGAQCMGYSGRCLLSDYMTKGERRANQGNCAQACRWSYKIAQVVEETRPDESYEIIEDEKGSHIMSTKDLCLVRRVKKLRDLGIDSFKIEGRTKSLYYVSCVARAYRMVLDDKINQDAAFEELKKAGNRGYTEGFFSGNDASGYSYNISKGLAGADFLGIIKDCTEGYKILIKNKILLNDEIEIITPNHNTGAKVTKIIHPKTGEVAVANTNDEVMIEFLCDNEYWMDEARFALLRTRGLKCL